MNFKPQLIYSNVDDMAWKKYWNPFHTTLTLLKPNNFLKFIPFYLYDIRKVHFLFIKRFS